MIYLIHPEIIGNDVLNTHNINKTIIDHLKQNYHYRHSRWGFKLRSFYSCVIICQHKVDMNKSSNTKLGSYFSEVSDKFFVFGFAFFFNRPISITGETYMLQSKYIAVK